MVCWPKRKSIKDKMGGLQIALTSVTSVFPKKDRFPRFNGAEQGSVFKRMHREDFASLATFSKM